MPNLIPVKTKTDPIPATRLDPLKVAAVDQRIAAATDIADGVARAVALQAIVTELQHGNHENHALVRDGAAMEYAARRAAYLNQPDHLLRGFFSTAGLMGGVLGLSVAVTAAAPGVVVGALALLATGSSGYLGWNLLGAFKDNPQKQFERYQETINRDRAVLSARIGKVMQAYNETVSALTLAEMKASPDLRDGLRQLPELRDQFKKEARIEQSIKMVERLDQKPVAALPRARAQMAV